MFDDASLEGKNYFHMLSVLQTATTQVYGRKPIFTDGARWYDNACKWLRLQHNVYDTELKNLMERFIQHIKDRTECVLTTISLVEKIIAIGSTSGTG